MGCWRADGGISDANDAMLRLTGYSRDDVQAGRLLWSDITPPEFAPLDTEALDEVRVKGTCSPFEKEYIRKDGRRVPVLIRGSAFEGSVEAGVFYAVDLTDRKTVTDFGQEGPPPDIASLSERQRVICLLLSYGRADKQIGRTLDLSLRTVELEKQRIAKQLDLATRQLLIWTVERRAQLSRSLQGQWQNLDSSAGIRARHND
jgi:PAS domain S-box-containing protein